VHIVYECIAKDDMILPCNIRDIIGHRISMRQLSLPRTGIYVPHSYLNYLGVVMHIAGCRSQFMRLRGLISLLNNLGPKGSHRKRIVPLFVP
jgi:hypothetical protein